MPSSNSVLSASFGSKECQVVPVWPAGVVSNFVINAVEQLVPMADALDQEKMEAVVEEVALEEALVER